MESAEQERLLDALCTDLPRAELATAEEAMLSYAVKLTLTPAEITSEDVALLRAEGFGDRAIHDICAITAYFAFVNRIADGLGVALEAT